MVLGSIYRQQSLYAELVDRVNAKAFAQSEKLLKKYLEQPRMFRALYPARLLGKPSIQDIPGPLASEVLGVLAALDANNLTLAQQHFDAVMSYGAHAEQYSTTITAMGGLLNSTRHLAELQTRLKESENEVNATLAEGRLIARDFSEIFGLAPVSAGADEFPPMYSVGVLSGLPKLNGLRDNIGDLGRLQIELEGLKATVKLEGENKHQAFIERTDKLRSAMKSALTRFNSADQAHHEALTQFDSLNAATKPIRQSLSKRLTNMLEQILSAPSLLR
ncbi:MAG: hypothetical protein K1X79_01370 [Oligoflexia bacterium]|nr:hypothetical protein [Oligoflexia bacterium]